jgi:hypothetical protein
MNTYTLLNSYQLCLPNIDLCDSEQAFADAFLKSAQILHRHLEQIESAIKVIKDLTKEPFNMATLGLFSKMSSHYYSYVFLEIHHDWIGSKFLIENLCEAAITLIYLLEEVDRSLFSEYISASVRQACCLLTDVEDQLQKFPNHSDLLVLRDKLETFINKEQERAGERPLTADSGYLWGPQEADTTAKRGAAIGLNFLTNPARQLALRVMPASWLDLQLSYLNPFDNSSRTRAQTGINFTYLRDTAHLCLHATQTFLEEVIKHQDVDTADVERQQQSLNVLYEWFHNAHHLYQLRCSAQERKL